MKRFLLKTAVFILIVALLDILSGYVFSFLRSKARGGQTYKNEYIAKRCKDDILILGSSKADHHYVPEVLEDSLKMTCYNAGEMGCGIIPAYVRYKLVSQRSKPKLVIYEVTPGFDYMKDNLYSRYLGRIRQYTYNSTVSKVYKNFSDNLEELRLISNMYRNNSCIVTNLKDIVSGNSDRKGYEPLFGEINTELIKEQIVVEESFIDSLKYSYVERLIKDTQEDDVPLLFFISPTFTGKSTADYHPALLLAVKYGIPVINNLSDTSFVNHTAYFQDIDHLNHAGAIKYSQYVSRQIHDYMIKR